MKALPPVSYSEHQAGIEKAKAAVAAVESEIETKNQEIAYLKELKRNHTAAVRDYQLAVGKLQSAKDSRSFQEYTASVNAAERVEHRNYALTKRLNRIVNKQEGKTKHEYFFEMLDEVKAWGLKPATVTGDSWYASKENLNTLKDKGFRGLFALEANRLVSVERGEKYVQVQTQSHRALKQVCNIERFQVRETQAIINQDERT